jgi:DNA-binding MarR family transcriptional regulator
VGVSEREKGEAGAGGADAAGLAAGPGGLTPEIRSTAVRVGTLFRHLTTFGDGGGSLRMIDEHGLSFVQFKAMIELSVFEPGSPPYLQELAEILGASMPSLSRAVDGLVRKGLVNRTEDPDDRRRRRIELSTEGRDVITAFFHRRMAGAVRFSAGLDDRERRAIDAAVDLLLERDEVRPVFDRIDRSLPR